MIFVVCDLRVTCMSLAINDKINGPLSLGITRQSFLAALVATCCEFVLDFGFVADLLHSLSRNVLQLAQHTHNVPKYVEHGL